MQNETETPSMQSEPLSSGIPRESKTGNGFDSVASQYRAMQEAQLLHEETINQLREEVRGQRERLAELARTNPGPKNGQLDIVMVRLTELERKIGEGAPDPLINEIVHRLAALENAGPTRGLKDPRVDEIQSQLEALRKKAAETPAGDSRTDDLVLRIASLEAAFRRAAQSRDPEEVQARIDALARELHERHREEIRVLREDFAGVAKAAEQAASAEQGLAEKDAATAVALGELRERLTALESQLADARQDERLTRMGVQLAALDRRLAEQDSGGLQSRMEALEASSEWSSALDGVADRVGAVEEKLQRLPPELSARMDALSARVSELTAELEESAAAERLSELGGRVRGLEERLEASSPAENSLRELRGQLDQLERAIAAKPGLADLARIGAELDTLKLRADRAEAEDLTPRLMDVEGRLAEVESANRLEDADARLTALETKVSVLGEPAEIGRRLTVLEMDEAAVSDPRIDDALVRLAALETQPYERLSSSALEDLRKTVANLHSEVERVSRERMPDLAELGERLTRLESRLRESDEAAGDDSAQPEFFDGVQAELQSLNDRLSDLASKPAQDARVAELHARVEWLEKNAPSATAQQETELDLDAIKRRIESIEEGLSSGHAFGDLSVDLRAELQALNDRVDQIASQPAASTAQDALLAELDARVDRLQTALSSGISQQEMGLDPDDLERRIAAVEKNLAAGLDSGALSTGAQAEIGARLQSLEQAVDFLQAGAETSGVEVVAATLQKETDRWNQWARSTIKEIADLREQVESSPAPRGAAIDAASVETLAVQITSTLNTSEVKSLRGQMYFIYLALGVIWAVLMYVLFSS